MFDFNFSYINIYGRRKREECKKMKNNEIRISNTEHRTTNSERRTTKIIHRYKQIRAINHREHRGDHRGHKEFKAIAKHLCELRVSFVPAHRSACLLEAFRRR